MALNNPMVGGPDFIQILVNAVERIPQSYTRPPPTGGKGISFRMREGPAAILDELTRRSGWNRNQVLDALIERGLRDVFNTLSDQAAKDVMDVAAEALMRSRAQEGQ